MRLSSTAQHLAHSSHLALAPESKQPGDFGCILFRHLPARSRLSAGQQKGRCNMRAEDRRKIEMGDRAAEFGHANPAESAAYTALLGVLDELRTRARTSAAQQLEGVAQARGASVLRQALEAELRKTHLPHLARVGAAATQDQPEVGPTYRLKSTVRTVRGFLTAVSAMAEAARGQRELLARHGL
jgi:hypothetical protein